VSTSSSIHDSIADFTIFAFFFVSLICETACSGSQIQLNRSILKIPLFFLPQNIARGHLKIP
jgi:hypothetical protein